MSVDPEKWREIQRRLFLPFPEGQVEFLPRAASGGSAMGMAYIDSRDVQGRLDAVIGLDWSFSYEVIGTDGKMVHGKLTVLGQTREDAGEADKEEEPLKSAVSDALKRCAVHFGIGRYLYYLPRVWAPFDPQKRRFIEQPRIAPNDIARGVVLASAGLVTHDEVMEFLGIQRRAGQPQPVAGSSPKATPAAATPAAAAPAAPAAPKANGNGVMPATDPDKSRREFFGTLKEHFGEDVRDDVRHAIVSELLGREITSQEGWDGAKWAHVVLKLQGHVGECPQTTDTGDCPVLAAALRRLANGEPEAPTPPSAPSPEQPAPPKSAGRNTPSAAGGSSAGRNPGASTPPANGAHGEAQCSRKECGKAMTASQVTLSQGKFGGAVYCPPCRKLMQRAA